MSEQGSAEDLLFQFLEALAESDREPQELLDSLCRDHPDESSAIRAGYHALTEQGLISTTDHGLVEHPEQIGDLRIERQLGSGAMGVVYLARDVNTGEQVSLKLTRDADLSAQGQARFAREAAVAAKLNHPGIAKLRRTGVDNSRSYCAFDYVPGISLAQLVQRLSARRPEQLSESDFSTQHRAKRPEAGAPSASWPRRCALLVAEVADALEHAHAHGVLHRDVKPSNIMLHEDGRAVLVDFGLASLEGAQTLTRTGAQLGSLPYMSPEQALGKGDEVDAASDVYSLGVTLYELLTLRPPYLGVDGASTLALLLNGRPIPPAERNATTPRALQTVCMRAMEREARYRFPSAKAFARELRACAAGKPIASRPPGLARRARGWATRRPAVATSLTSAGLALLALPLVFAWSERKTNERTQDLNRDLTTALGTTQQLNADLNSALTQSQLDVASAERHYGYARQAIVDIAGRIANKQLARTPQMDRVRNEVLAASRGLYAELETERPDDPRVHRDSAFLSRSHAATLFSIGENDAALAVIDGHAASLVRLEQLGAPTAEVLLERAEVANLIGSALVSSLNDEEVLTAAQTAIECGAELIALEPDNEHFLRVAAEANLTAARALSGLDRGPEAHEASEQALTHSRRAALLNPTEPANQAILSVVLSGTAAVGQETRLRDDVMDLSWQSLAAAKAASEADPTNPNYVAGIAASRLELTQTLFYQDGEQATILEQLELCRGEWEQLVTEYPSRDEYWLQRARVAAMGSRVMQEAGDAQGAMQADAERIELQVRRHQARPADRTLRRQAVVALMTGAFTAVSSLGTVEDAGQRCVDYAERALELAGEEFEQPIEDHMMRSLKVLVTSFAVRGCAHHRDEALWGHLEAMEACLPMSFTEATMATCAYLATVEHMYAVAPEGLPDPTRLEEVQSALIENLRLVVESKAMAYLEFTVLPGVTQMAGHPEFDALMAEFERQPR